MLKPYNSHDLTVVICAYKECNTLEKCIRSILRQTEKVRVCISTSTPNQYIKKLAEKYHLPLYINPEGGHVQDYNFALSIITTRLGMLAHQDDLLHPKFVEKSLKALNKASDPILSFTNYVEMHDGQIDQHPSAIVMIKRLLVWPMRVPVFRRTLIAKRLGQSLGNPITHPTVICVMNRIPQPAFCEKYKAVMDWDLWERLSWEKGEFVYVNRVLLCHRMSDDNATAKLLESSNIRYEEEKELLS